MVVRVFERYETTDEVRSMLAENGKLFVHRTDYQDDEIAVLIGLGSHKVYVILKEYIKIIPIESDKVFSTKLETLEF